MLTITATFTADPIEEPLSFLLRKMLFNSGKIKISYAPKIVPQLADPNSDLNQNTQGINIILIRLEDWLGLNVQPEEYFKEFLCQLSNPTIPKLILLGLCPSNPNLDAELTAKFETLEIQLQQAIKNLPSIYLFTPQDIQSNYPVPHYYNNETDRLARIPYTQAYFTALAAMLMRKIHALNHVAIKVIILDFDDTLIQGVCSEDALENLKITSVHKQLHHFLIQKQKEGTLLCLCSNNTQENDVWNVFDYHPDMLLKREHIVAWRINQNAKATNIRELAQALGFNSLANFAFIDNSSYECNEIRKIYPEILTIQFNQRDSSNVHYLRHLLPFDRLQITPADQQRTARYQKQQQYRTLQKTLTPEEFIKDLNVKIQVNYSTVTSWRDLDTRSLDLIRKTNRFNCRKRDINQETLASSQLMTIDVSDRLSEDGLMGIMLFAQHHDYLEVTDFLLSCSVMRKGVEYLVLNELGAFANKKNIPTIKINFVATDANDFAKDFLFSLPETIYSTTESGSVFTLAAEVARTVQYRPKQFDESSAEIVVVNPSDRKELQGIDYFYIAEHFSSVAKILDQLKTDRQVDTDYQAPHTELEKNLVELWQEILNKKTVGINDNFLELGGDSFKATILISRIDQLYSIQLPIGNLLNSTIVHLASHIQERVQTSHRSSTLLAVRSSNLLPLSFAQKRLWLLEQLEPNSALYNMFIAFELHGNLDISALNLAFITLIKRHESFRTAFIVQAGQPYQLISADVSFNLRVEQTENLTEQEINRLTYCEAQKPFDFNTAPLLRVRVLARTSINYILMICVHHIIHDGWSFNILCKELNLLYAAYASKNLPNLPPLDWQYADFSQWQQQSLDTHKLQKLLYYWTGQLTGFSPIEFPADYSKSSKSIKNYQGARIPFVIAPEHLVQVKKLAQCEQTTLYSVLFSMFAVLIGRYSAQEDLVIGTPISGRHYPNVEKIIGFFINILILRTDLSGNPTFLDFLQRNKKVILDSYQYQDLPFESLVAALNPTRVSVENPLVKIMFIFQNYPTISLQLTGIKSKRIFSDNESLLLADYESAKVDFSFYIQETSQGLQGLIEYNTQLFATHTIEQFIVHFQTLLTSIINNPQERIAHLALLDERTRVQLLSQANQKIYPLNQSLCVLFQKQVEQIPNHIAVSLNKKSLTYQQLNVASNQLAHYLVTLGVQRRVLVGIYLERGFELIISILAILKTGAAYVCIDPNYPEQRAHFLIRDCQPHIIVSNSEYHTTLCEQLKRQFDLQSIGVIDLDQAQTMIMHQPINNLNIKTCPNDLVYIIYTSGSTGTPKAVLIEQAGVVNMACAQIDELGILPSDRILQFARFTFDAFVWELFGALLAGAQLCLISKDVRLVGNELLVVLQSEHISIATLTPSVLDTLPCEALPNLRLLVLAGEQCSVSTIKKWHKNRKFIAYGPTEGTVCSSLLKEVDLKYPLSIGVPFPNIEIYLLDTYLQLVPPGIPGEICLGGIGVARGYLKRDELTQERFVTCLIGNQMRRIYRTGDRGKWVNGHLEYHGRMDTSQIKLRGVRIELDEIKQEVLKHPAIENTVILVQDQHLVAYLVAKATAINSESIYAPHPEEQIQHWEFLYEDLYKQLRTTTALNFNYLGWNSSYTKQPFLEEEMQEWVDHTVQRILALKPERVLEIGCGAGLLMTRIAPYCRNYTATDFSSAAINYLKKLTQRLALSTKIQLLHRPAHVFDENEYAAYDVIIINSVIQYFPDLAHLIKVLEGAMHCTRLGGKIFIGDVRSLVHLEALHGSIILNSAQNTLTYSQWRASLFEKIQREEELAIDSRFFEQFAQSHPLLDCAVTQIRRGKYQNELTQFRYDVILYTRSATPISKVQVVWSSWGKQFNTLQNIRDYLAKNVDHLAIRAIPNRRIENIVTVLDKTQTHEHLDPSILKTIQSNDIPDPETFALLSEQLGYQFIATWSKQDALRCIDIIFFRGLEAACFIERDILTTARKSTIKNWLQYANQPQTAKIRQNILIDLRNQIKKSLPDYMIPKLTFIEKIPLTSHGKFDSSQLPKIHYQTQNEFLHLPITEFEKALVVLWKRVLQIDSLSINDNFFAIGGESLTAAELIAAINQRFEIKLPVKAIWDAPTIKKLGVAVEIQYQQKASSVSTPPWTSALVKLKGETEDELPIFFIHPAGGTVFCYQNLIQCLNNNTTCYAIQDPSIDEQKILFSSIEEMAKTYIQFIQSIQPHGPYKLVGYSAGGTIAVEITRQLIQLGEKIQFVFLLDTWAKIFHSNTIEIQDHIKTILMTQYESTKRSEHRKLIKSSVSIIDLEFWLKLGMHHMDLVFNYQPPTQLDTQLILFKAQESVGAALGNLTSETNNYWHEVCNQSILVHEIPGSHESILQHPNVRTIAKLFDFYLSTKIRVHDQVTQESAENVVTNLTSIFWKARKAVNNLSDINSISCNYY